MIRRLFNGATIFSTACCMSTIVAWWYIAGNPHDRTTQVWIDHGSFLTNSVQSFGWGRDTIDWLDLTESTKPTLSAVELQAARQYLRSLGPPGSRIVASDYAMNHILCSKRVGETIGGPFTTWKDRKGEFHLDLPVILFAVLPLLWCADRAIWSLARPLKRVCFGHPIVRSCSMCGYNLTGNISGVCPECGTCIASQFTVFNHFGEREAI